MEFLKKANELRHNIMKGTISKFLDRRAINWEGDDDVHFNLKRSHSDPSAIDDRKDADVAGEEPESFSAKQISRVTTQAFVVSTMLNLHSARDGDERITWRKRLRQSNR